MDTELEKLGRAARTGARATKPEPPARFTERGAGGVLPSSRQAEIDRLKGERVVSLFTKRGPFWESVEEVRERWGVAPRVQVPPAAAATDAFDPEFGFHLPEEPLLPARVLGAHQEGMGFLSASAWKRAINGLQERTMPEKYHSREALREWGSFFAACVLYDPPETALREFAAFGGPEPEACHYVWVPGETAPAELPRMVAPPVKTLYELTRPDHWLWDCIIHGYERRLRSSGRDPYDLLDELERDDPGLLERRRQKAEQDSRRYYIEIGEGTTQDDVENAFRMIRATQPAQLPKGRTERDRLTAVQCAVLYEPPEWTYKKLAESYGLGSKDTAKRYVRLGREILEQA